MDKLTEKLEREDRHCPSCRCNEPKEDTRRCHLCGGIEENKWCVNTTCYEYTKHENLYPI
jgi:hypothetical protein